MPGKNVNDPFGVWGKQQGVDMQAKIQVTLEELYNGTQEL